VLEFQGPEEISEIKYLPNAPAYLGYKVPSLLSFEVNDKVSLTLLGASLGHDTAASEQ